MEEQYGHFIEHVDRSAFGVETKTVELVGGPLFFVERWYVDGPVKVGAIVDRFGYKMRIIDDSYLTLTCILADWPMAWWVVLMHKVKRVAKLIGARMILTLAVWNLADFNPAREPSWRDIWAVKYALAKWQKMPLVGRVPRARGA